MLPPRTYCALLPDTPPVPLPANHLLICQETAQLCLLCEAFLTHTEVSPARELHHPQRSLTVLQ